MNSNSTWQSVKLKYLASIEAGQSPPSESYSLNPDYGLPFLQGSAGFGKRTPEPTEYCSEPTKVAPNGSILVSVRAPVGDLNLADRSYGIGRGLCAIIPKSLPKTFLWWSLHANREQLYPLATGSTYDAVSAEDVGNVRVLVTNSDQMDTVADFLDAEIERLDALVAAKELWLKLLAKKRSTFITEAVTGGGLRNDGIPVLRLKWLLDGIDTGFTPDSYNYPAQQGQRGVLKSGCVNGGVFDPDENKLLADDVDAPDFLRVSAGDILMSRASGSLELIGSVAQVDKQPKAALYLSDKTFRLRVNKTRCDGLFLVTVMGSSFLREQLKQIISGAEGLAKNIAQSDLREVLIPSPTLAEQRAIVAYIAAETSRLDGLCAATKRTIDLLTERRTALIAAAVAGTIKIKSAA